MVRSVAMRCVASGLLTIALTMGGVVTMAAARPSATCERAHHSCADAVLTADCCCQPALVTAAPASVFTQTWSSLVRMHWASMPWFATLAGTSLAISPVAGDPPPAQSCSPPIPSSDRPTVLLI